MTDEEKPKEDSPKKTVTKPTFTSGDKFNPKTLKSPGVVKPCSGC